jgi:hypothetical protein
MPGIHYTLWIIYERVTFIFYILFNFNSQDLNSRILAPIQNELHAPIHST